MIGRTLDAILSPFQIIGRECRSAGEDSIFLSLVDAMRNLVLPVEKCGYWKDDGHKVTLYKNNWSVYSSEDWELKRDCAKAFEQRRKVNVGEKFYLKGETHTGFGSFHNWFSPVERISDNAVVYREYLISSDENMLIDNRNKLCIPVLYHQVIW